MSRILKSTNIKEALKARQKGFILNPFRFSTGVADPEWANVIVLLHMDGPDNSTTFTDSSSHNYSFTRTGTPVISSQAEAFSGSEMVWANTNNQYISAAPGGDFLASTTTPLTVECFVNITAISSPGGYADASHSFLRLLSAGIRQLEFSATTSTTYTIASPGANAVSATVMQRNHLALVRDVTANRTRVFVNGVKTLELLSAYAWNFDTIIIGHAGIGSRTVGGNIEEVRITAAARYSANFTPPTTAFPNS